MVLLTNVMILLNPVFHVILNNFHIVWNLLVCDLPSAILNLFDFLY